ncbi:MAG: ABC transporter permease [Defluviitaleaceae bacterium]|nr:ABC transporter permease [Defluviitaleaceae bacterium]
MQTYKTFLKLIMANHVSLIIYIVVFVGMVALFVEFGGNEDEFAAASAPISVIMRDNHPISNALLEHLNELHTVTVIEDSYRALEDDTFFNRAAMGLVIDQGFGQNFYNGNQYIRFVESPDAPGFTVFAIRQIDSFLQNLQMYLAAGVPQGQAIALVQQSINQRISVTMTMGNIIISPFFFFLVFIFVALITTAVSPALVTFKEKDRASRLSVSATSSRARLLGVIGACITFAIMVWAGLMVLGELFFHHETLLSQRGVLHMANALIFILVVSGIAMLMASITASKEALGGMTTLLSVLLSFTSGAFVPKEFMSDTMYRIAQFSPSYWFNHSNRVLYDSIAGTSIDMNAFGLGIVIQLAFALALFSVALLIGKEKVA